MTTMIIEKHWTVQASSKEFHVLLLAVCNAVITNAIWLRSNYDVSCTPASIRRDSTTTRQTGHVIGYDVIWSEQKCTSIFRRIVVVS